MKRRLLLLGGMLSLAIAAALIAAPPPAMAVTVPPTPTPIPPPPQDGRINQQHGDLYAILIPAWDDQGDPDLQIWCVDANGKGTFSIAITNEDLAQFPAMPSTNTLVKQITGCRVPVKFYILTTGEYQVNIGPDAEGKVDEVIFTGLPPTHVYYHHHNPE